MNTQEKEILKIIKEKQYKSQRDISDKGGYSLGLVNSIIKSLKSNMYLDDNMNITKNALELFKQNAPKSAIILAAGYGMRMVPINFEVPKGIITVKGEPLVERIIKQLYEVDVKEIYIIVGFMKESYEYLIDKYNVKLIFAKEYATKNNLHSLKYALDKLSNTYIIPCDIWCKENPFSKFELYSWYMISNQKDERGMVRVNKKYELVCSSQEEEYNKMIGISYFTNEDSQKLKEKINQKIIDKKFNNAFWEEALIENGKMIISAKIDRNENVFEINNYEELRDLDSDSKNLENEAIQTICETFNVKNSDINNISILKKGMTNRSFIFSCKDNKYIMRIPGEGSNKLINRKQEYEVYNIVKNRDICDDIVYINSENGYKITKYIENARTCNPLDLNDVKKCINKLKEFHELELEVKHEFNIWNEIDFYEKLWDGKKSIYSDYEITKKNIFSLKKFVEKNIKKKILSHIDANPDNFLISSNGEIRLIDWEYAGMQDPDVDIAMFAIYAMYDKKWTDKLIDIYFDNECDKITRIKIYSYMAICGLLWSNWCEYKRNLGVEYGEYSLAQYRYAKDYYNIVQEELKKMEETYYA